MPTANELLHDALVRRQIYLSGFSDGLANDIIALLDATERDLRIELADRLSNLAGREFSPATLKRIEVLANALERIRRSGFDAAADMWDEQMRGLADAEVEWLNKQMKSISPVVLDTVLPAAELLSALVDTQPLQGRLLSDWASRLADADKQRITDAIRIGMAQGESTENITRRVIGTRALNGADGVLQTTRRDALSITDTAVKTIAGEARQAFYSANDDILSTEVFVAVLDSRTTPECRANDGKIFEIGKGPQPPLHWRCRSTRVPTIDGRVLGERPAVSATERTLSGLSKADRRARVAELVGTVPAETTYQQFLTRQTHAFQDEVLGPNRAKLFRDGGLTLDRFVNTNGRQYTLNELRELEPEAFRRAGF